MKKLLFLFACLLTLLCVFVSCSADSDSGSDTPVAPPPANTPKETDKGDDKGGDTDTSGQEKIVPKPTYTVSFEVNGGTSVTAVTVTEGNTVSEPTSPTKENYIFSGWFSDSNLTAAFNFNTPITADTKLYAKWLSPSGISVTISPLSTISITKSETAESIILTAPSGLADYKSYKWTIDDTDYSKFSGASANEDRTVLTISKEVLLLGAVYQVSLYVDKDGIPYSAQIAIKKGE